MCDCIKAANKVLAAHKTAIDTCSVISAGKFEQRLCIPTYSTDKAKRKKPAMRVFATFCPMCGEKFPDREGAAHGA